MVQVGSREDLRKIQGGYRVVSVRVQVGIREGLGRGYRRIRNEVI